MRYTEQIAEEFQFELPDWIVIQQLLNIAVETVLSITLGPGEASAIALAYDFASVIIIIDDLKARKGSMLP